MPPPPSWLPDLKVEVALSGTVTDPTQLYDTALWDTALYADQFSFVDITAYVISVNVERGLDRSGRLVVGQAVVELDNTDRRFSPANTAGAYAGNVKPWRAVRITSPTYAATGVMTGYALSWVDEDTLIAGDSTAVLTVVDAVGVLAATDLRGVALPSELVGDRISRLAALSGLLINVVGAGTGILLQASTADGSALDQLTKAVTADGGVAFVDAAGTLTFISRATLGGVYLTPNWRMGDTVVSPYRYRKVVWEHDGAWVANRVTGNRLGSAVTAQQTDEAAAAESGLRSLPPDTLKDVLAANDSDVADLVIYRLGRSSRPVQAPGSVELQTMAVDVDQRALAAIDINSRAALVRTFPSAPSATTTSSMVRAVKHTASGRRGTWDTVVDLIALPGWMTTPPLYDTAIYDTDVYA
jgi:hypothetical protein